MDYTSVLNQEESYSHHVTIGDYFNFSYLHFETRFIVL